MSALVTMKDVTTMLATFDWSSLPTDQAAMMRALLEELRRHMLDARARGELPAHVAGQLSPGEILSGLEVSEMSPEKADLARAVVREVVHLRKALTNAQNIGTRERDQRMRAEKALAKVEKENNAIRAGIVSICEHGAAAPDVDIIVRTPLTMPPIEDRSPRWREAEARIAKAADEGRDPDQKDLDIVLQEHLKHEGFDSGDEGG